MEIHPPKLDSLPTEIIQRIASLSCCESVLSLLKVNHQLREACNDTGVFKKLIKNRNGEGGEPWDLRVFPDIMSTSDWARYALADSKGRQWIRRCLELGITEESEADSGIEHDTTPSDMTHWTPQLLALNHPILTRVPYTEFSKHLRKICTLDDQSSVADSSSQEVQSGSIQRNNDLVDTGFCILAASLEQILPSCIKIYQNKRGHSEHWLYWLEQQHHPHFTERYQPGGHAAIVLQAAEKSQNVVNSIITQLVYEFLIYLINSVLYITIHIAPITNVDEMIMPPLSSRITLHTLGFERPHIKPPFLSDRKVRFTGWDHNTKALASYLCSGEWVGYYTILRGRSTDERMAFSNGRTSFDPPMDGIRFALSADHPEGCELQADGVDSVGEFMLKGHIKRDGSLELTKSYKQGHSWQWHAELSPLGIVGTWGEEDMTGGYVWLWKKEWSYEMII